MLWKKYTIHTTTADCELVCAILLDYGITDVQIENNVQLTDEELNQMYADFVKELPEDDGSCAVSFYLDENGFIPEGIGTGDSPSAANEASDFQGIMVDIAQVKQGLAEGSEIFGIAPVQIEEDTVDPLDWKDKWKENFKPFRVGNVIIKPTWEEVPEELLKEQVGQCEKDPAKIVIDIDPGMAFGTGTHETTQLCLTGLQKYLQCKDRVLDLGCGSGILGIAALKMGAACVTAVDIDEQAVQIARENFALNFQGYTDCVANDTTFDFLKRDALFRESGDHDIREYMVIAGNVLEKDQISGKAIAAEPYDTEYDSHKLSLRQILCNNRHDIVLANILAEVIIPLSKDIQDFLVPGGIFISSGILDTREAAVVAAIEENPSLELLETSAQGEWRSVIARRIS